MKTLIQAILIILTITSCQRNINLRITETTETVTNLLEGIYSFIMELIYNINCI